ncbi:MAG TPA: hypothetical protein VK425_02795 [Acidimicrobiales bacterium]|nr:hypothetical protein [Acidimicrobiales bacterium]
MSAEGAYYPGPDGRRYTVVLAPPFVATKAEVCEMADIVRSVLAEL